MPLSDNEQQILHDIESHLAAGYTSRVSDRRPYQENHLFRLALIIGAGLLTGLFLLFVGLSLGNGYGTGTGVLGGVLVIAAANLGVMVQPGAGLRRLRRTSDIHTSPPAPPRRPEHQ